MPLIIVIGFVALVAIMATLVVSRPARAMAAALVAQFGVWLIWAAQHAAPEIAAEVTTAVAATLETLRPTLQAMIAVMLRELAGVGPSATSALTAEPGEFLRGQSDAILRRVVSDIRQKLAPEEEITAESGIDRANDLVATILTAGMEAWIAELAVDLLSLGKFGAVVSFHDAVIGGLGLQRMVRLIWRAPVNEAITKPLTTHYLRTYRQTELTPGELVRLYQRQLATDETVLDRLRSHGYSYDRAVELLNIEEKRLSTAEGLDLYRQGDIELDTLRRMIREQGYGEARTEQILAVVTGGERRKLLATLAETARRLFKAGDITEDELRQYLSEARLTDAEIALVVAVEQLALREEKALPTNTVLEAFEQGVIEELELRVRLRKQHYTDGDIDILLTIRAKKLSPAQVLDAFVRGRIDRDTAVERLTRLGYRVEDIPVLLDLRTRELSEGQVIDALVRGQINLQDARARLQRLGFADETIDILLAFQRKVLSPGDVQAALVRGLISVDAARTRLREAGYSADDVELLLELRFRLLTAGQIIDAYGEDIIERSEAFGDLLAKAFSPEDAEVLLAKFDARQAAAAARRAATGTPRRRPTPPPPAPAP